MIWRPHFSIFFLLPHIFSFLSVFPLSFFTSPVSADDSLISNPKGNSSFKSMGINYYLSKDPETGLAKLHIVETLVAIFSNTDRNYGFFRAIPITDQGGKNITIPDPSKLNPKILRNGKPEPYTSTYKKNNLDLYSYFKQFDKQIKNSLQNREDFKVNSSNFKKILDQKNLEKLNFSKCTIFLVPILLFSILVFLFFSKQDWINTTFGKYSSAFTIKDQLLLEIAIKVFLLFYITFLVFSVKYGSKYLKYTYQGLDKVTYLTGLEQYIKMAEADRLHFLQSVKGADTSGQGIVKIYERLLPYAIIFRQEKSWVKTLERYYQSTGINNQLVDTPWHTFTDSSVFSSFRNNISHSSFLNAIANLDSYDSSSSSSLSGFSNGEGFSGGRGGLWWRFFVGKGTRGAYCYFY